MNGRTVVAGAGEPLAVLAAPEARAPIPDPRRRLDRIGLQLYTVRGLMAKDFEGTLAKVAQIGYREVEFAGYFDHPPKDVRAMLDRLGPVFPAAPVAH